jgi:glutamine amidotransferase
MKVPHMGWNQVRIQGGSRLFAGVAPNSFCYFAHSYYLPVEMNQRVELQAPRIAALADYSFPFVAAIEMGNVYGVQFHPEKSGDVGMQCLSNFLHAAGESARVAGAEGSDRAS